MIPYFSIEAIKGRNGQTIILTSIRCSMITILSVGDGNNELELFDNQIDNNCCL